jgi:hypothetical protein
MVKDIRNDIEYRVYQELMTPNGLKIQLANGDGTMIERTLQQQGKGFMIPPLNASDY